MIGPMVQVCGAGFRLALTARRPQAVAVNSASNKIYVANNFTAMNGGHSELQVKTRKDFRTINVQWNRQWCLFCPSGHTKNQ